MVSEADLLGTEDKDLLAFAREKQRVIVTQDRDFLQLAAQEAKPPGAVYAPQERSIGKMVRMLDLLCQVSDAALHSRSEVKANERGLSTHDGKLYVERLQTVLEVGSR